MTIIETDRLTLRHLSLNDAFFIYKLVNNPTWIQYIGDRNVKSPEDARQYLESRILASYTKWGFGFYLVTLKAGGAAIGICGLVKREGLDNVDIGFALLPEYAGQGYAYEAAAAVLQYAQEQLGLQRIVAITTADNVPSLTLLQKLGLRFEKMVRIADEELLLLAIEYPSIINEGPAG